MLNLKLLLVLLIIIAILTILYFTGRKSVHQEVFINASPEKTWSVLIDTDSYDSWNPVMRLLEGEVKEGGKVKYRFTQDADNVSEISSNVKKIIPNKLLNQSGGIPILLTFNHEYVLTLSNGGTKLIIQEYYIGIGVNFWNPEPVEAAYGRLVEAIKKRVESK